MEAHVLDEAHSEALAIVHSLWAQLDEDILLDFAGQRVDFSKLSVENDHWALLRGDGRVETAHGILSDLENPLVPQDYSQGLHRVSGRLFATDCVPLIPNHPLVWEDIPEVVRRAIRTWRLQTDCREVS